MFARTASERDLEAVRALLVDTWHATYDAVYGAARVTEITDDWHSFEALKARLGRPNSEFILADDGRTIGGMAFASATDEGRTLNLHQLYVRPALQGRGTGSLLLAEIIDSFPQARRITLEVEESNGPAIAFYEARGFRRVGRTENCGRDQSGIPALVYERTLS
ncbi:MAG: GNAT family N-acetyltransferase [Rhizobiaceae bacterium]